MCARSWRIFKDLFIEGVANSILLLYYYFVCPETDFSVLEFRVLLTKFHLPYMKEIPLTLNWEQRVVSKVVNEGAKDSALKKVASLAPKENHLFKQFFLSGLRFRENPLGKWNKNIILIVSGLKCLLTVLPPDSIWSKSLSEIGMGFRRVTH